MNETTGTPLTGRKVFMIIAGAFSVIIAVNLTLAFKAVSTFPGLETKNSYVSSQTFEADRAAQRALGWDVTAEATDDELLLRIAQDGESIQPEIVSAVLGRATHVAQDEIPDLRYDGDVFRAPAALPDGNWNLRLVARADDGTLFRQRVVLRVKR